MRNLLRFIVVIFMCTHIVYADTETLQWYVDGNVYTTTTCESGGDIVLPNTPTKYGYTFQGWFAALYDMSTLDVSIDGDSVSYKNRDGGCYKDGQQQNCANPEFSYLTQSFMYKVTFDYGTVYGKALCSVTRGYSAGETGAVPDQTTSGRYCWCKITGFEPNDSDMLYETSVDLPWGYYQDHYQAGYCVIQCFSVCASEIKTNQSARQKLFNASGQ